MALADTRLKLLGNGYIPTPCAGKRAVLDAWPKRLAPTALEIERWPRTAPAATNTGILTRPTPTLDIDILDPEAAAAVEDLVRERFEERGPVMTRFGLAPKRAIPFRTDTPFPKNSRQCRRPRRRSRRPEEVGEARAARRRPAIRRLRNPPGHRQGLLVAWWRAARDQAGGSALYPRRRGPYARRRRCPDPR